MENLKQVTKKNPKKVEAGKKGYQARLLKMKEEILAGTGSNPGTMSGTGSNPMVLLVVILVPLVVILVPSLVLLLHLWNMFDSNFSSWIILQL